MANTDFVPYYAVIFTSKRTTSQANAYAHSAQLMESLAKEQEGFLGVDSARNEVGITVSYWTSLEAIARWKQHTEHQLAQERGQSDWYAWYHVRICKVEREYKFDRL